MRAEILACGTELLMGELVDTNSSYIAGRLPAIGIDLRYVTLVGDNFDDLVETVQRAFHRSDIVFITGGLGPTPDDLTREAIAAALDEKLTVDPQMLEHLQATFRSRGNPMPEGNIKQATRTPSTDPISNPMGTAPGWWSEKDKTIIVAMPGVPSELKRMWEQEVEPILKKRHNGTVILSRTLKTFGYAESAISDQLNHLFKAENPYLGIYAKQDGIQLRIIARGANTELARGLLDPLESEIREIVGEAIWGTDDETMEGRLAQILKDRQLTVAVMESCTGGLLASCLTDLPGSSRYFRGGIVTYANDVKITHGIDPELIRKHGVVSSPVAEAMAKAVRSQFQSDIGLAVTGVTGPDPLEGVAPGNIYTGVAWLDKSSSTSNRYPPTRLLVKRRAVHQALLLAYETVQNSSL